MILRKNYGVDLGSSNIKVYSALRNKQYIDKNMLASRGRQIIAVGNDAYEMYGKTPVNVSVHSPMAFGMIADVELEEIALYSMLKKIDLTLNLGSDFYFTVPLDMTAIEKRAYYRVVNGHWLKNNRVFMVETPIADALALGIRMENNTGSMLVHIGAQTTQLSVISDGRIIISKKVPIGGSHMNEAVVTEVRRRYGLQIGYRTGKRLKLVMGRLNEQRKDARKVVGIDTVSGLPREEAVSSYVVNAGIMNTVNKIASELKTFLERTPPQISYQIAKEGIFLTGGATRLPFIDKYLASFTGFTFNLSEHYEYSSLFGLREIIHKKELKKWAQPVRPRRLED